MSNSTEIVCLSDFESYARKTVNKNVFDYFQGGANDEETVANNIEAFKRYKLLPRVLQNVSVIDLKTSILGFPIAFPVCLAPTCWHELAHPEGEIATAKAAEKMGTCYTLSFSSSRSMYEVSETVPGVVTFLQIRTCRNREIIVEMIGIAERQGFKAVMITVDASVHGRIIRNIRNKYDPTVCASGTRKVLSKNYEREDFESDDSTTWDYISWIKSLTKLPIVVKGILTAEDALMAVQYGAAGIVVSNHGGRQLDCVPATIDVLADVVKAVAGRCEVYMDGGVRKGTDVLKALALGARAVFVGRPTVYALAYNGEDGVHRMLQILKNELIAAMKLSGCSRVEDVRPSLVKHQSEISSRS